MIPRTQRERKRLLVRVPGVLSAVARRLRVRDAVVSRVYHGLTSSARIRRHLEAEITRRLAAENGASAQESAR
jgi:hypothetical protein